MALRIYDEKVAALVEPNLRLAYREANRYGRRGGMTNDELASEAVLALWEAAQSFDPARGFKFSSYAVPSIRRALWKAMRKHAGRQLPQEPEQEERRFDQPTGLDGLPDDSCISPADDIGEGPDVLPMLDALDAIRRQIVELAFGLSGVPRMSTKSIAARLHTNRDVVLRLLKEAIAEMRAHERLAS